MINYEVKAMYAGRIKFSVLPDIGFAIRHYSFDYKTTYGNRQAARVEIAYINSGSITLTFNGQEMYAPEGSIVVLFRQLSVSTRTVGDELHSHDTVLAEFEDLEFGFSDDVKAGNGVLTIPFVTEPSDRTEKIGIELRKIISDMSSDREGRSFYASVAFVSILKEISDIYYEKNTCSAADGTADRIRKFIDDNIQKNISVTEIAKYIGKSPNYAGQIFKKSMGMTINSYVNMQKVKKISLLIKDRDMSFKDACDSVCVYDEAYGYRLFKKYMGLTPGQFLSIKQIERDR